MNRQLYALLLLLLLGVSFASALSVNDRLRRRVVAQTAAKDDGDEDAGDEETEEEEEEESESEGEGEGEEEEEESEGESATELVGGGQEGCEHECEDDNANNAVEDALNPISEWLENFKKKSGGSDNLYEVAEMSVQPMLNRLKQQQERAVEKLQASNDAILQHIREAATEHMFSLLKAAKAKDDKEASKEKEEEKKAAEEEEVEQAKEEAKLRADQESDD